jgi:hypothetical protein
VVLSGTRNHKKRSRKFANNSLARGEVPPTALNAGMSNRPAQQSRIVRRDPLDHENQRLAENLRHERVNAVIGDAPDRRLPPQSALA